MFGTPRNPAANYRNVELETEVASASPHKLILMLMDGALLSISRAQGYMAENRIAEKGKSISMAIDIIGNGLKASLNYEAGDVLAERLGALYDYMCTRLLQANLRNDRAALDEVARLLGEIKSGWEEIDSDPAVLSANSSKA
ncbi:MAG TPA: flagellar export chaperone FliS [Rhodocyclaceae bacterium]